MTMENAWNACDNGHGSTSHSFVHTEESVQTIEMSNNLGRATYLKPKWDDIFIKCCDDQRKCSQVFVGYQVRVTPIYSLLAFKRRLKRSSYGKWQEKKCNESTRVRKIAFFRDIFRIFQKKKPRFLAPHTQSSLSRCYFGPWMCLVYLRNFIWHFVPSFVTPCGIWPQA
jgi:hypothetical protein